jgi:hypothetical protein
MEITVRFLNELLLFYDGIVRAANAGNKQNCENRLASKPNLARHANAFGEEIGCHAHATHLSS